MKLSAREQIMLISLTLLMLVFGGYKLLLQPTLTAYSSNQSQYTELLAQQATVLAQINQGISIDTQVETAKADAEKASASFFPSLESYNLNLWLNDYFNESGLTVVNLTISDPVVTAVGAANTTATDGTAIADTSSLTYPIADYAAGLSDTTNTEQQTAQEQDPAASVDPVAEAGKDGSGADDSVLCSTVDLVISADSTDLINKFCDSIKNCGRTVVIRSITFSEQQAAAVEDKAEDTEDQDQSETQELVSATVSMDFYAVKKGSDGVFSN